jgi:hypothetical protein
MGTITLKAGSAAFGGVMERHGIADRLEINERVARYCHALDRKD